MVSIVMPVYNAAPYLPNCLDSIINQSYAEWELIAVNDFSTDRSNQILVDFERQDSRIKVFQNKQKGIISALQLAYQSSNGEYITRMDADDLMVENKMALFVEAIKNHNDACIVAKVKYFSDEQLGAGYLNYAAWINSMIDKESHFSEIYKECVIPSPNWMMARKTFDSIGGFSNQIYPEDYDLAFRVYEHQIHIHGLNHVLHYWRDHDSRASRNDSNYSNQAFLPLKIQYFKKLEWPHCNQLILWGAGKSAKAIAQKLLDEKMRFQWVSGNSNKIGHLIYGQKIKSEDILPELNNAQLIIGIKETNFKEDNQDLLERLRLQGNKIFFFH